MQTTWILFKQKGSHSKVIFKVEDVMWILTEKIINRIQVITNRRLHKCIKWPERIWRCALKDNWTRTIIVLAEQKKVEMLGHTLRLEVYTITVSILETRWTSKERETHADETWTKKIQDNGMNWRQAVARRLVCGVYALLRVKRLKTCVHGRHLVNRNILVSSSWTSYFFHATFIVCVMTLRL